MARPTFTLFPQPFDARAAAMVTQGCFVVIVGLAVLIIAIVDASAVLTMGALASLAIVIVATAIVMSATVDLAPSRLGFYVVPALDALAIVAFRVESPALTTGALLALVVPAAWLGTSGHAWSIALAGGLAGLAVVPDVVAVVSGSLAPDAGTISLIVLIPVGMAATALFTFGLVDEATAATSAETASRQLRDAIVETVDVGILVIDADSEVVLVNRVIRDHPITAGIDTVDAQALRNVRAYEADGETPYEADDGPIRRAMLADESVGELFWVASPDGATHAFVASSTRLRDTRGEVEATVIALNEVTQFLDAVQARDRLISAVSHELRTPLTAMKGFLELARESLADASGAPVDSDRVSEYLRVVDRNLDREHAIIEQFILAADLFEGRLQVTPAAIDLTALVHRVVAESTAVTARGDVAVRVIGEPLPCRADVALMSTAIDAVLTNAISASTSGEQVTLSTSLVEEGKRVRLEVTDTGPGIADVEHRRLFEPFFRTQHAHANATAGLGLGLPLVKQVVDAHHGSVGIATELGVGTTVTIELPIGDSA